MVSSQTSWPLGATALLLAMLSAAGCGSSPPKGQVKGKVLLHGTPMRSGTVTFVGADGQEKLAPISSEGIYQISDLAVGEAKIGVASRPPIPEGLKNFPGPPGPGPTTFPPPPEKAVEIPSKYNDPDKSGLTYDVKSGEQDHTIELAP
jgi:hypothetical protein